MNDQEILQNEDNKCRYWLPDQECPGDYKCNFEVEAGYIERHCIFHLEKTDVNGTPFITVEIRQKFEEGIRTIIKKSKKSRKDFIDFRGFKFPYIKFDVEFPKKADFSFAEFMEDVDFTEEFKNPKPAHEYDTEKHSLLAKGAHYRETVFKGNANFKGAELEESVTFIKTHFFKKADFQGLISSESVRFEEVIFEEKSQFEGAKFEYLEFSDSQFLGEAKFTHFRAKNSNFYSTNFHKPVDFEHSNFGEMSATDLEDEQFNNPQEEANLYDGHVSFYGANFYEKVSFLETAFLCPVGFYDVIFHKQVVFIASDDSRRDYERIGMFQDGCDFIRVSFSKDENPVFFRTDLKRAKFHDTNIEKAVFRDVFWETAQTKFQKLFRGKAYLLWDEIRPIEGMRDFIDNEKTAENYRQLVLNYEIKRDYETAEYFHIGEMEMRRKILEDKTFDLSDFIYQFYAARFSKSWYKSNIRFLTRPLDLLSTVYKKINGYGLYLVTSRYGTSYKQALVILTLLIAFFSFLFLFTGIKTSKEVRTEDFREIEYNIFPDSSHVPASPARLLNDYIEGLSYSFSIITFQKERFYEPLGWQGRFALYLAVLVLTAQSALVLLAIRRQFRR